MHLFLFLLLSILSHLSHPWASRFSCRAWSTKTIPLPPNTRTLSAISPQAQSACFKNPDQSVRLMLPSSITRRTVKRLSNNIDWAREERPCRLRERQCSPHQTSCSCITEPNSTNAPRTTHIAIPGVILLILSLFCLLQWLPLGLTRAAFLPSPWLVAQRGY